jgi:hypothetical protein
MPLQTVTLTTPIGTAANWTVPANVYRINILQVGGGGAGGAGGSGAAGGGGGGGRVVYRENVSVTPGTNVSYTIGAGGAAQFNGTGLAGNNTTILSLGAPGGNGGIFRGIGGTSSRNILGAGTNTNPSGSNAAGAGGDGISTAGGIGYLYNLTSQRYGGGGGGGTPSYAAATARPVIGFPGGVGGGAAGGGEGTNGGAGVNGLGGGGGGGASNGTATTRTQTAGANAWTTVANGVAATQGGNGGAGAIVISYDVATFVLTADKAGVAEGDSIVFTLRTTNVPNGASVPYSITGPNVTVTDFSPEGTTGNFVVTSTDSGVTGTATISILINSSPLTEGEETATITVGSTSLIFKIGDSFLSTLSTPESIRISQQQYNNIRNPLVAVMGSGSADSGWNMPIRSSSVAEGNKVTINEWSNLRFDIINSWVHLYGGVPSLVSAIEGEKIRANNTTAPYLQYQNFVNNIVSNKFGTPHSSQSVTRTANPSNPSDVWQRETTWPSPLYGNEWRTKISATATAVWSSPAAARHFFNSGGEIRFSPSRVGGTSNAQGNSWTNLLNSVGTVGFGGAKPNQGTSPSNGLNYYRLTNSYQEWFRKETTTPYSSNYFRIFARSPNFSSNAEGLEFRVDFFLEWVDDYVGSGGVVESGVTGTMRYSVSTIEAFQVLQPSGTGNLTVETPTFTLSSPIP